MVSIGVLRTVGDGVPTGIRHHRYEGTIDAEEGGVTGIVQAEFIHEGELDRVRLHIGGHIVLGDLLGEIRVDLLLLLLNWVGKGKLGKESRKDGLLEHVNKIV